MGCKDRRIISDGPSERNWPVYVLPVSTLQNIFEVRIKMRDKEPSSKNESKRNGWKADDLGEQSSYEGTTEMDQRLRRQDETVGDPNARDVAGAVPEKDTAHGRDLSRKRKKSNGEQSGENLPDPRNH